MAARFFVDENDLALGKALAKTHGDVVYPGHHGLVEVPRGAPDDDWLPVIGRRRLVVITRDSRIRYREAEKRAWVEYKVRGFVLTGRKSQATGKSLEILERHWGRIIAVVGHSPMDRGCGLSRIAGCGRSTSADSLSASHAGNLRPRWARRLDEFPFLGEEEAAWRGFWRRNVTGPSTTLAAEGRSGA